ncbi:MAG: hypothetical protein MUF42_02430 [Cytophagaceae bacterium]|jgi:GT2 family glycosyltransferase|nr:hypothetical protein [Cytophagaceae bacterium]
MRNNKIGIGYITCNNQTRFTQTVHRVPDIGEWVIINDGRPYPKEAYPPSAFVIEHTVNQGVGKSKNEALQYLMEKGCEHIFLVEDDVIIVNPSIFYAYIDAARETGILHFNYALQGPHNRKQPLNKPSILEKIWKRISYQTENANAADRVKLDPLSAPDPRLELEYPGGTKLRLFRNCAGAFCYYHRSVLNEVGLMDENFRNAWEHVHHTYKIIQAGFHPPFWWFADIEQSEYMLDNTPDCIVESTIGKSEKWLENVEWGANYFKKLEGKKPGEINDVGLQKVRTILKELKRKNTPQNS